MAIQTLTLTDFLLARIAEDEARARDERDPQFRHIVWNLDHPTSTLEYHVLAECEAKRRIVDEHEVFATRDAWIEPGCPDFGCGTCHQDGEYSAPYPEGWCRTLRLLALPYADHPDYREEWRP